MIKVQEPPVKIEIDPNLMHLAASLLFSYSFFPLAFPSYCTHRIAPTGTSRPPENTTS